MSAAPSRTLYRAALLGLFGGAVLALWLMIRPPSVPGEESVLITEPTPTPALTPGAGGGPGASTTTAAATATPTPAPTAETTPAPTPTPGPVQYTVEEGDTWFGVADAFGVDAFALAQFNGRTLDEYLHTGDVLLIPPQ
jgi:LysM repeat protein